jgi:hypothetical protein
MEVSYQLHGPGQLVIGKEKPSTHCIEFERVPQPVRKRFPRQMSVPLRESNFSPPNRNLLIVIIDLSRVVDKYYTHVTRHYLTVKRPELETDNPIL